MKSETQEALNLAEQDIQLALESLNSPCITDNLHRLGTLGKLNVDAARLRLEERLRMMRLAVSNAR